MENIVERKGWFARRRNKCGPSMGRGKHKKHRGMCCIPEDSLVRAELNKTYTVKAIRTHNDEMKDFLFTLGCYEGEHITMISVMANQHVIVIKDARYRIDIELAASIIVE